MGKVFNTTAVCVPEEHYMVNIDTRLKEIRKLVDGGKYFTINRARQYGKTTTLRALHPNRQQPKGSSGSPGWGAAGCYFVARIVSKSSFVAITCGSVVTMDWVNV